MMVLILLLLLVSGGSMLHSIYVIGKGGVYPSRRKVVDRFQISVGAFLASIVLLLALWII